MSPVKKTVAQGKKRVGIWIRVSTEDQAKGESPQHHEQRARWYAASRGWEVVELYDLAGVSGKSVINHPEALRMMEDIEQRRISALIFSKLARLGRNIRELLDFSSFFQEHGAELISLEESIDASTPSGRLFFTMMAGMAHWEREETSERVKSSVVVRAKMGKRLGAAAPFGYQWVNNQMLPHPEEAPVRRLIHELYLQEKRLKTVIRKLTDQGYRNRKGKEFSPSALRFMFEDTTPKGVHRANYMTLDTTTGKWGLKPPEEWVYHEVPPIISAEVWDQCHDLYRSQKQIQKQPAKKAVQLFAGLLWCECGNKMYVPSNTPKYVCQECRNKIPIETMEAIFIEELKRYILSPEDMREYLLGADEALNSKTELLEHLQKEKAKVRQEADRLYRFYMDAEIAPSGFGARNRPLEERLAQLAEEIPRLQAEIDIIKVNRLSSDEIISEATTFAACWSDLSQEGRRKVVENLVERINLGRREIEIHLYFLPEFLVVMPELESDLESTDEEPPKTRPRGTSRKSDAPASVKRLAKGVRIHSLRNP